MRAVYTGPDIDDRATLDQLPLGLRDQLLYINGFVAYGGGLHLRGCCFEPRWHSLHEVWHGEHALSRLFRIVTPKDIPFAQDGLGDQFILRDSIVHRLCAETGELESLKVDVDGFLASAEADPMGFLLLQPMVQFFESGGRLAVGQSLSVYPPFCAEESAQGVSYRPIDSLQLLLAHSRLANAILRSPAGSKIDFAKIML